MSNEITKPSHVETVKHLSTRAIVAVALIYLGSQLAALRSPTTVAADGVPDVRVTNLLDQKAFWSHDAYFIAYFCQVWNGKPQICTLDRLTGRINASPSNMQVDPSVAPAWSPDSDYLTYRCLDKDNQREWDKWTMCLSDAYLKNIQTFGPYLHPEDPTATPAQPPEPSPTAKDMK